MLRSIWEFFNNSDCSQAFFLEDGVMKKLTIGYVRERVAEIGYVCLSNAYVNNDTKLLFICDKGHEYRATWGHIQTGGRCIICNTYKMAADRELAITYLKEMVGDAPLCACGCGKKVTWNKVKKRWNNLLVGHKIQKIREKKICTVDNCDRIAKYKNYCVPHYMQFKKHGYTHNIRPIKNEVRFEGDVCYIQTYDKYSNLTDEIIIDTADYELVSKYRWGLCFGCPYCYNPKMKLSRFLMKPPSKEIEVDHKNRNILDNRRDNLRLATRSQNGRNRGLQKNNTSGYCGVRWRKDRSTWSAFIKHHGKNVALGCFSTKEEAAAAYNEKAIALHGEFAVLNEILVKGGA